MVFHIKNDSEKLSEKKREQLDVVIEKVIISNRSKYR